MASIRPLRVITLAIIVSFVALAASSYLPDPAAAVFNDSDGDGVIDLAEELTFSDPHDPLSTPESTGTDIVGGLPTCNDGIDNDLDGLTDLDDPACTDSDNDFVSDPGEVFLGSDPNNAGSFPEDTRLDLVLEYYGLPIYFCSDGIDNDLDGLSDGADPGCDAIGSDGDAFDDATEKRYGSDPSDPNSVPEHEVPNPGSCSDGIDNDLDGLTDAADPSCAMPANDDRADAQLIAGLPFTSGGVVVKNATNEPGEPVPSCAYGSLPGSLWYRYVADDDATLIADTAGSNFSTLMGVWQQDGGFLTEVACGATRTVFDVSDGDTYLFQVGGYVSEQFLPELVFNLAEGNPPENNGFLDATAIGHLPFHDSVDMTAAGLELGEPAPPCAYFSGTDVGTVWYTFQPNSDVLTVLDTEGSDFPAIIGVWRQTIFGLSPIGCAYPDDAAGATRLSFQAQQDRIYFIQIARLPYYTMEGPPGFDLQFNATEGVPPANDDFANAQTITSLPFSASSDMLTASVEPGEPQSSCLPYESGPSVWYRYTPADDVALVADTSGSPYLPTSIAVYQGDSLAALTEVGCSAYGYPYTQFAAEATAGETYYFQVILISEGGPIPVPLAAADRGWGDAPRAVEGELPPEPAPSSGVVFFNLDSLELPSCAAPEFTVPDPIGDTFGFSEPPIIEGDAAGIGTSQPDIVSVSGGSDEDTFCLNVEFAGPIDPPSAGTGQSVVGYIDFDIDTNPLTGFSSANDAFCPQPAGMGAEVEAVLFEASGLLVPLYTITGPLDETPYAFLRMHDQSFDLIVPLSYLGGDDAFSLALVMGSYLEPTDCAPNGGVIYSPGGFIPGDVNCNSSPGPVDASLILQYVAGLLPSLPCQAAGDVNGDGRIDTLDVSLLLQYVAQLIPSLPPPTTPGPLLPPEI